MINLAFFWFVTLGLIGVVAALLLANYVTPVGALVDAPFFQLVLTLIICLIITIALFAFFEKSTATVSIPDWSKVTIKLGGPIAGFVAMLFVIFPNLTPTARMTLYFRDGTLAASRPAQVSGLKTDLIFWRRSRKVRSAPRRLKQMSSSPTCRKDKTFRST